jgi:PadR family transcriptional regulator, regulatory protein PadR
MIGEFEYLILAATSRLGDNAYGASIRSMIETVADRRCSVGALYTTLDRLEEKGLITTQFGEPTAERGGRAKRMVHLTSQGIAAAREFYAGISRLSVGVTWSAPA